MRARLFYRLVRFFHLVTFACLSVMYLSTIFTSSATYSHYVELLRSISSIMILNLGHVKGHHWAKLAKDASEPRSGFHYHRSETARGREEEGSKSMARASASLEVAALLFNFALWTALEYMKWGKFFFPIFDYIFWKSIEEYRCSTFFFIIAVFGHGTTFLPVVLFFRTWMSVDDRYKRFLENCSQTDSFGACRSSRGKEVRIFLGFRKLRSDKRKLEGSRSFLPFI